MFPFLLDDIEKQHKENLTDAVTADRDQSPEKRSCRSYGQSVFQKVLTDQNKTQDNDDQHDLALSAADIRIGRHRKIQTAQQKQRICQDRK